MKCLYSSSFLFVGGIISSSNAFQQHQHRIIQPPPQSFTTSASTHAAGHSQHAHKSRYYILERPALARTTTTTTSTNIKSKTSLRAIPLPLDLGLEDLIYQAQSTASRLASASINNASSVSASSLLSSASISSLAVLYIAGLLTSFSPCSLGLLPLTVSYISNAAGERDDKAVFFPTLFFALGLASVFCGLGLSVALLGGVFGSSSSPSSFSLGSLLLATLSSGVSIAMGLQLLELVNLPLPSLEIGSFASSSNAAIGSANKNCSDGVCTQISYSDDGNVIETQGQGQGQGQGSSSIAINGNNGGTGTGGGTASALFRTFLLGGSSALVASPCATPVLTSILAFVATSRDPVLGAVLLFIYTIGYSTPLLIVGASGGQALANAQAAASSSSGDGEENSNNSSSLLGKIGSFVNPLTASVLIWYGTNGFLQAVFGDPSYFALNPILDLEL